MSQPPNVIYIHSHDTGRCTQPYGYPVHMPAFQRVANDGIVFRRALSAAPTCSPSRAALLTGEAPHSSGMIGLAHRGFSLRDPGHHLAAYLAANGYDTILAGHQHLTASDPHTLGYRSVLEKSEVPGSVVAQHAVDFLMGRLQDSTPFFLDVGFSETHRPFHSAPPGAERFISPLPGLPDTQPVRADTADFHASLLALDKAVGQVLDALDASRLADRSMVIITTDHGPPFPGYKATLTDGGLGVGLIVRLPGVIAPGTVSDALVSQLDLYPTICDIAGIPIPAWTQGHSLVPLLEGATGRIRSEVFGEVTFHAAYEPQRSIRTDRWLYIRRFGDRSSPVLPNIDRSPALSWLLEHEWARQPAAPVQLYDNAIDPLQKINLAGNEELSSVREELDDRLTQWMRDTRDPLLTGSVPLPPGARVNRASDLNPDGPLVSENYQ
jgi:arylsulfatase A-like enzyme